MNHDDIAAVIAIETQCYPFPWTTGNFVDSLQAGYRCSVYEQEECLLGYAVLSVGAGEAHLLNLAIAPEVQGCGLGGRFLRLLIVAAAQSHAEIMWLEVRPSNRIAVKLYKHMGFNEIAVRKNYYPDRSGREDALVMRLEMTDV